MIKQNLFLEQTYGAITNALNDPSLLAALVVYGYHEARLQEGLNLYTHVKQLTQQREQATQAAGEASAMFQSARDRLMTLLQAHRDTARLAYKREAAYTDHLKLTQRLKGATADRLAQAETFYANVPRAMMEKYQVPRKELNEAAKLVAQVRDLHAVQRKAQGQVQTLTQARLQALKELEVWMRRFMKVAKVALEEQPQQLEALYQTVA